MNFKKNIVYDKNGLRWKRKFAFFPKNIGIYTVWLQYYWSSDWHYKQEIEDYVYTNKMTKPT